MHCGQSPPPSSMASIISGALGFCGMFRQVDFSHIRRQGNKPAHLLAKHAKCIVDYVAWIEETPCFLMQALTHDVSISIWVIIKLQSSYPKKKDKAFYIFLSACSLAHLLQTTLLVQPHKKTINWCHPFEPPLWAIHNRQCWPYQPSSLDFEREKKWVNGTRSGNISGEKESRSMGFGRCFKNWTGPTSLNENWALIQTNQKPGWTGN